MLPVTTIEGRSRMNRGNAASSTLGLAMLSASAGAGLIVAAFKYSELSWIVDAPGWLAGRFLAIDFHEGEGALGSPWACF
jgi:hypothetical protein